MVHSGNRQPSKVRQVSWAGQFPKCVGGVPVMSVQDLVGHLVFQPVTRDFWIPIPTRATLALFLSVDPPRLDFSPEDDPNLRKEFILAGLLQGIILRKFIMKELKAMLSETGSHCSQWPEGGGVSWWRKVESTNGLLERDIHDLDIQYIFHWYDLRTNEDMAAWKREIEEDWEMYIDTARRTLKQ